MIDTNINLALQFGDSSNVESLSWLLPSIQKIDIYVGLRFKRDISKFNLFKDYLSRYMNPFGYPFNGEFFLDPDTRDDYNWLHLGETKKLCQVKRERNHLSENIYDTWDAFWYGSDVNAANDVNWNLNYASTYSLYELMSHYNFLNKMWWGEENLNSDKCLLYPNSVYWNYPGIMYFPHMFFTTNMGNRHVPMSISSIESSSITSTKFNCSFGIKIADDFFDNLWWNQSGETKKLQFDGTTDWQIVHNIDYMIVGGGDPPFSRLIDKMINNTENDLDGFEWGRDTRYHYENPEWVPTQLSQHMLNAGSMSNILELDENQMPYFDIFLEISISGGNTYWVNTSENADNKAMRWGFTNNKFVKVPYDFLQKEHINTYYKDEYDEYTVLINNKYSNDSDSLNLFNKYFYDKIGNTENRNDAYPSIIMERDTIETDSLNGKFEVYNAELYDYFTVTNRIQSNPSWLKWTSQIIADKSIQLVKVIKENETLGNKSEIKSSVLIANTNLHNNTLSEFNLDYITNLNVDYIEHMRPIDDGYKLDIQDLSFTAKIEDNVIIYELQVLLRFPIVKYKIEYNVITTGYVVSKWNDEKQLYVKIEPAALANGPISIINTSEQTTFNYMSLSWGVYKNGIYKVILKYKNGNEADINDIIKQKMYLSIAMEEANELISMSYGEYSHWQNNDFVVQSRDEIVKIKLRNIANKIYYNVENIDGISNLIKFDVPKYDFEQMLAMGQYELSIYDRTNKLILSNEIWITPKCR